MRSLGFRYGKSPLNSSQYRCAVPNQLPKGIIFGSIGSNYSSVRSFKTTKPVLKKDFYKILGVTKHASKDEIKRNFRELAKKYHPDLNKEATAEAKFKEVAEAHEVLEDDHKRKLYDSFGHDGVDPDFQEQYEQGGFDGFHGMPMEFDFDDFHFGSSKSRRRGGKKKDREEFINMEDLLGMFQGMSGMGGGFDMGLKGDKKGKSSKFKHGNDFFEFEYVTHVGGGDPFFPGKKARKGGGGRGKKPPGGKASPTSKKKS